MLGGFILTFVGAGLFDIANGAPLTALQILWVNFAIDLLLAIGLGFDAPVPGLMQRSPRDPNVHIVPLGLGVRVSAASAVMAALALGVVAWAEHHHDLAVATTMGLTTLSLMHVAAALEAREADGTIFTRYTIANGRFVQLMVAALSAHLPRHVTRPAAADLRHGGAVDPTVGDLPARTPRLHHRHRADQAREPDPRPQAGRSFADHGIAMSGTRHLTEARLE